MSGPGRWVAPDAPPRGPWPARRWLAAIVALNVALTLYGLGWGLPDRWCLDEQVASSLRLLQSRSMLTVVSVIHPQLYNFFLAALFVPYLLALKIGGYPFDPVQAAGSVSWLAMTAVAPEFGVGLYVIARLASVALGAASVVITYRIGKLLYGERAGLVAGVMLAVTMGFVETNHLAKHTSLVVLLVLVAGYLSISAYRRGSMAGLFWASFVSGLAFTAKLDGAIAGVFVIGAYGYLRRERRGGERRTLRDAARLAVCFVVGVLAGWPAVLSHAPVYLANRGKRWGLFYGGPPAADVNGLMAVLEKARDNLGHIFVVFGAPLGVLALASFAWLIHRARRDVASRILLAMMLVYSAVVVGYYTAWPGAYTKLMIHLVPTLAIAMGGAVEAARMKASAKGAVLAAVVVFSVFYTYQADAVYAERDTRYAATSWIEQNIPRGASIAMVQEIDLLFSSRVLRDYEILYLDRSSRTYTGSLFRSEPAEARAALDRLDREGSRADYFALAQGRDFTRPPAPGTFLWRLLNGRDSGYDLVRSFTHRGTLLAPKPGYASPDVLIFRRK